MPTEEDNNKLKHLLGYLLKTVDRKLILQPSQSFKIVAYIVASFALHDDGKSHTGIIVFIAGVAVFCAARKQKCVRKSLTEVELVALSDNLGFMELSQEFLCFVTNSKIETPLIYQDNTSVISLVTEGGGIMRTKTYEIKNVFSLGSCQRKESTYSVCSYVGDVSGWHK